MNPNDPFFALGGERTIIKPRLGKVVGQPLHPIQSLDNILGAPVTPGSFEIQSEKQPAEEGFDQWLNQLKTQAPATKNILLAHATPLLRLICSVSERNELHAPKSLSKALCGGLTDLDHALEELKRPQAERLSVRYLLCTFMDERAANTPWGGSGQWASHSLLLQFFSETWGGEKVFALIQKMMQSPAENRELLDLMAVVLSLGLKGKYKVEAGGEVALSQLRTRLFQLVQSHPLGDTTNLHPDFWQSKAPQGSRRFVQIPLWLPISAMSLLGMVVFLGLYFDMNTQSDTAFNEIVSISFAPPEFPMAAPENPTPTGESKPSGLESLGLQLPVQLQQEIIRGQLTLKQLGNRSTVILVGDGLFNSGSAELTPTAIPLVEKVAQELAKHPGQITVTGYTDNQPIRSIRFPSNWQLSAARAEHVGERIATFLPNVAIASEGAGAANPIAPNDNARGRALNRRVEITLLHTQ